MFVNEDFGCEKGGRCVLPECAVTGDVVVVPNRSRLSGQSMGGRTVLTFTSRELTSLSLLSYPHLDLNYIALLSRYHMGSVGASGMVHRLQIAFIRRGECCSPTSINLLV